MAVTTLDAAVGPGMRFTAVYPSRIDPKLHPDAIPTILSTTSAAEAAETQRRARVAARQSPRTEAELDAYNATAAKLVAHFDALLR